MSPAERCLSTAIVLVLAGCRGDFELPPQIATSKYIAYHTDADASVICMDDFLAREDEFIERTAALLGVDPPAGTIHFVWDLEQDGSEPWACEANVNCYQHRAEDDLSVVVSQGPLNHHELVHAIDARTLGTEVHQTLEEGLAEYLGTLKTTAFASGGFPAAFTSMIAESPIPSDYGLAMHFVGSIFARHGAEKYRALRAGVPAGAGPEEFAAAFETVYGQPFFDALVEMNSERVDALDRFPGCDGGEGRELAWTSESVLEVTIAGSCGDPWFFGAGLVEGRMGFFGYYVIEVPRTGEYELTVGGVAGAPEPLRGSLTACSLDILDSQAVSRGGQTGRGSLLAGRHALLVAFPPRSEARGEATIRLEYVGPAPAP